MRKPTQNMDAGARKWDVVGGAAVGWVFCMHFSMAWGIGFLMHVAERGERNAGILHFVQDDYIKQATT
jgi:hypothetical protein